MFTNSKRWRHFAAMALIGDGVMALFGPDVSARAACRQALTAAFLMSTRMVALNQALAPEIDVPLRIGLGIHFGPAIVGEMGYGRTISLTAVGDSVNTASRLEALAKSFDCELVVSEDLVAAADVEIGSAPCVEVQIRGRRVPLIIRKLKSARDLPQAAVSGISG